MAEVIRLHLSALFVRFLRGERYKSSFLFTFSRTDHQTPSCSRTFEEKCAFAAGQSSAFLISPCLVLHAGRAHLARVLCCVGSPNECQTASIFSKQPHLHAANAGGGGGVGVGRQSAISLVAHTPQLPLYKLPHQ